MTYIDREGREHATGDIPDGVCMEREHGEYVFTAKYSEVPGAISMTTAQIRTAYEITERDRKGAGGCPSGGHKWAGPVPLSDGEVVVCNCGAQQARAVVQDNGKVFLTWREVPDAD